MISNHDIIINCECRNLMSNASSSAIKREEVASMLFNDQKKMYVLLGNDEGLEHLWISFLTGAAIVSVAFILQRKPHKIG